MNDQLQRLFHLLSRLNRVTPTLEQSFRLRQEALSTPLAVTSMKNHINMKTNEIFADAFHNEAMFSKAHFASATYFFGLLFPKLKVKGTSEDQPVNVRSGSAAEVTSRQPLIDQRSSEICQKKNVADIQSSIIHNAQIVSSFFISLMTD